MSLLAFNQQAAEAMPIDSTTMDFLANDLDDSVSAAEEEAIGLSGEIDSFKIETRDQAEYFTRCLVRAQKENEAVELVAKKRLNEYAERVNAWKESKLKENSYNIERWTSLLRPWAEEQLKDSKKKSVKLIEGTLGFRKSDKYEYDDERLIEYLQSSGHKELLIEQTPKVDKTALKKAFDFEKENVPGVTYTKLPDTFTVK